VCVVAQAQVDGCLLTIEVWIGGPVPDPFLEVHERRPVVAAPFRGEGVAVLRVLVRQPGLAARAPASTCPG